MISSTDNPSLTNRRIYSERPHTAGGLRKLRVVQLGSYPASNRGARTNILTLHQRLQERGHESVVIDLTPHHRLNRPGIYYPRSFVALARLLFRIPADIVHLHFGSKLTTAKLLLAAMVHSLPNTNSVCTLHLGGHFSSRERLNAWRWSLTGIVVRHFDSLIAVNPEIASFFERLGVTPQRIRWITPFPRLRLVETVSLPAAIENFCRQHAPLIISVGEFEPGIDKGIEFDVLTRVRERYPSAGLLAIGGGSLQLKTMYECALHQQCNHILLPGALSEAVTSELIRRANILLQVEDDAGTSVFMKQAVEVGTPIIPIHLWRNQPRDYLPADVAVDAASAQVVRGLQTARPKHEDMAAALTDGVDDVIRLYKQLTTQSALEALHTAVPALSPGS